MILKEVILNMYEKTTKKVNDNWTVITLDSKTEIYTNMKLIDTRKFQYITKDMKSVSIVALTNKEPVYKQIEKAIGEELDMNDVKIKEFMDLYPCSMK